MEKFNFIRKNLLAVILFFYFIIASAGIFFNFSLFNTTGDEAPLLSATLKMIADGSFRPDYPSFYHLGLGAYLYLPFFLVALAALRLSGLFPTTEALKQFGQVEFAKFLPLGRFISVLIGAACLYLLYKICEKLFANRKISLLAVFFLSSSLLFVQTSHFSRIWLPQILTVLLAMYFILDLYQAPSIKLKHYLLSGLGVGLAFGTHVVGAFIYLSFLLAHYFKNSGQKLSKIFLNNYFWLANLTFALIYVLVYFLNTYGFTHYLGGLLPDATKMLNLSESIAPLVGRAPAMADPGSTTITKSIIYYLSSLWYYEPLLLIGSLFGAAILSIKQRKIFLIIFSFAAVYFLAISSISIKIARYLLPIFPVLAIFSAYGWFWLLENVKYKKLIGALLAAWCLASLYAPLLWDYKFLLPSSRLSAANWIYNNLSSDKSIINFDGHLELNENLETLIDMKKYTPFYTQKRAYLLNSSREILPKPNYYIFSYLHYKELAPEVVNKKYDYLLISWLDLKDRAYWLNQLEKINLTAANLVLLKRFPADATDDDIGADLGDNLEAPLINLWKFKQNGPIVDIYEINYGNRAK